MKTTNLFGLVVYLISLILFFNHSSFFVMWVVLEVNMLSFLMLMYNLVGMLNKQEMMESCFYYFLVQSFGSLAFLLASIGSLYNIEFSELLMSFSLSLKLSLFPFFFWLFKICQFLEVYVFIFLVSIQKLPLLFFCYSMNFYFHPILILSTIFGAFYLFYSMNFVSLIVSSSIYSSFWMFFLFYMGSFTIFSFFLIYTIMLFQMGRKIYLNCKFSFLSLSQMKMIFFFAFFLGLPPLSLFFFKILVVGSIFQFWTLTDLFIFWGVSYLGLFGYLKLFYKSFFSHIVHYLNNEKSFQKKSFFYFAGGYLMIFLLC